MRDGESSTTTNVSVEEDKSDHIQCSSSWSTGDRDSTTGGDDEQRSEHDVHGDLTDQHCKGEWQ